MRFYGFLADLALLAHALYSLFLLLGLVLIVSGWVLGWRWTRTPGFRFGHLVGTLLLAGRVWLGLPCPFTALEDRLRVQSSRSSTVAGPIQEVLHRLTFRGTETHGFGGAAIFFSAIVVTVFLLTQASDAVAGVVALRQFRLRISGRNDSTKARERGWAHGHGREGKGKRAA